MSIRSRSPQVLAGLIASVAWTGLALQLDASIALTGSAGAAILVMLRYFTVITNLALAAILTGAASGSPACRRPFLLGGMTLSILLVGIIYGLLLRGLFELDGGAKVADTLLHKVTPVLAASFWLACVPKGTLRRRDPLLWALYPLAYLAFALIGGELDGFYPYPFINVAQLGWARAGLNGAAIALGFILAGYAVLWLDTRLPRGRGTA